MITLTVAFSQNKCLSIKPQRQYSERESLFINRLSSIQPISFYSQNKRNPTSNCRQRSADSQLVSTLKLLFRIIGSVLLGRQLTTTDNRKQKIYLRRGKIQGRKLVFVLQDSSHFSDPIFKCYGKQGTRTSSELLQHYYVTAPFQILTKQSEMGPHHYDPAYVIICHNFQNSKYQI